MTIGEGGGSAEEIVFRMRLDDADLRQIMGVGPGEIAGAAAGAGGGGGAAVGNFFPPGGGGGGRGGGEDAGPGQGMKVKQDPSFMAIFKPLAALAVIGKGISTIVKNSSVANAYLGGMGKMFGAAMDMLLLPFTPILNLIMVAMSKLMQWLFESGILEKMYEVMSRAAGYLEGIVKWMGEVWAALKAFDLGKLAELIIKGIGAAVKTAIKDPLGALATAGVVGGGALLATKALGLGGLVGGAGGMAGGALGGLGGLAGGGAMAGAGIAGAAVGGGVLSHWGWNNAQKGGGTGWAGVGGMAAGGALMGGAVGSVVPGIGTGIGAAAGGIIGGGLGLSKKFGLFGGGGGDEQAAGPQNMENVGNVANIDITINAEGLDEDQMVSRLMSELDAAYGDQGYTIKTRSY